MLSLKLSDLAEFVSRLFQEWAVLLTGGGIMALLSLLERYLQKNIPGTVYLGIVALFVVIAFFRIWKTQRAEIAQLRVRPYDEEQRRFIHDVLRNLTLVERDVIRFLLL